MNISLIVFWIIIGALVILFINLSLQLYRTIKEITEDTIQEKQGNEIHCPYCGTTNTSQITKMIIIMQLPGAAIDCACFYCNNCSKRWFMELDTLG